MYYKISKSKSVTIGSNMFTLIYKSVTFKCMCSCVIHALVQVCKLQCIQEPFSLCNERLKNKQFEGY